MAKFNSHENNVLNDLRVDWVWTHDGVCAERLVRVRRQIDYLESDFGAEARNDGLYEPAEIADGLVVLRRYLTVFE